MDVFPVNWDSVPEVMNKEQFFRICHISKSTALHLLKSGKVPCEWSGKKTRCYKIRKEDVKAYLEERAIFPELYSAPKGWYGTHYVARLSKELPEDTLRQMHGYYEKLLRKYPENEGDLCAYSFGDGFLAAVYDLYDQEACGLMLLDTDGKSAGFCRVAAPLSLDTCGSYTALLTADGLSIYDRSLRTCAETERGGFLAAYVRSDGTAFCLDGSQATLFIP